MKDFNEQEAMKMIDTYINKRYQTVELNDKVFYQLNELWGWRFYLKALRHRDFASIKGHIKREYFNS